MVRKTADKNCADTYLSPENHQKAAAPGQKPAEGIQKHRVVEEVNKAENLHRPGAGHSLGLR
jgi:hypothetical protein